MSLRYRRKKLIFKNLNVTFIFPKNKIVNIFCKLRGDNRAVSVQASSQ